MTTDHADVRRTLATALVTAVDHVGIAVPDLDEAIAWYHDHLGMIVLHEEVNDDQGSARPCCRCAAPLWVARRCSSWPHR